MGSDIHFYVERRVEGPHFLEGQLSDDGTEYVGVYVSDPGSLEWQNCTIHEKES